MKRILLITIIIAAAAVIPNLQPSASAEETWTIRTGLNFTPGLVYNRSWDPGYNGTAMTLSLGWQNKDILLEAGAEAGYSYTGFSLLFPLQAGLNLAESENLKLSAIAAVMPGLILSRPSPYFLIAAELAARLTWKASPGFNLALSAGPRYTTSITYSSAVAPLELIDLTIGLTAEFKHCR